MMSLHIRYSIMKESKKQKKTISQLDSIDSLMCNVLDKGKIAMNITVTGYFGSGSSAVLDLLSEYSSVGSIVKDKEGGYENTTLYHPGGIFDLEDKLLLGNDIHRSDEALRTFKTEMMRLNENDFGWYGSFEALFGKQFENILNEFIEDLKPFEINARYYGQCEKVIFNPLKIPVQMAAKVLLGRTIYKWGRQFIYKSGCHNMFVAFPSPEEFYKAAKKFVKNFLNLYSEDGKEHTVFDRLLLCHNLYRIPQYFGDDFRVVRVQRDIRDVYFFNKYLWKEINAGTMYPDDMETFIDYWKRINAVEKPIKDSRILTINFEDLIYRYDDTVNKIEEHCGLNSKDHVLKKERFDPQKSIKNTQVFRLRAQWKPELQVIENQLSDYLYSFPYENVTAVDDMFDDSRVTRKIGLLSKLKTLFG